LTGFYRRDDEKEQSYAGGLSFNYSPSKGSSWILHTRFTVKAKKLTAILAGWWF
jgi:hypothetical protein